jgi:hypothetical protein
MSERAVPFYCPYCGDEDLEPYVEEGVGPRQGAGMTRDGGWHCRACARAFRLRFVGIGVAR